MNGAGTGIIGVLIGTLLTGVFAWLTQRNKGQVEESVSVRAEWEKLTGALSARLAAVEKEFAEFRRTSSQEMAELRRQHSAELEEMRESHRAEMKMLRELNDGLQRQILQNSKSVAQRLGDPSGTALTQAARKKRGESE